MTSLLSPLCFVVVDEQLVEDSLEAGLTVLSIHTSSGKSAATVALRFGLAYEGNIYLTGHDRNRRSWMNGYLTSYNNPGWPCTPRLNSST